MAENNKEKKVAPDKKAAPEKKKSDKPSFGKRMGTMWRAYKSEFKKISWTPLKQVKSNSLLVFASVIALSAVIGAVDYLSSSLIVWVSTLISL